MTNLKQAKQLKTAGWEQDKAYHAFDLEEMIARPDEKEMMEFLLKKGIAISASLDGICFSGENIHESHLGKYDITEILVQACVKVLEDKGGWR